MESVIQTVEQVMSILKNIEHKKQVLSLNKKELNDKFNNDISLCLLPIDTSKFQTLKFEGDISLITQEQAFNLRNTLIESKDKFNIFFEQQRVKYSNIEAELKRMLESNGQEIVYQTAKTMIDVFHC